MELKPDLLIFDRKRKENNRRVITTILITAVTVTAEALLVPASIGITKVIICIVTGLTGLIITGIISSNYRKEYKSTIIARIARFVDEGLTYNPDGFVSEEQFVKSRIFTQSCDSYEGEDHFRGKIGKTEIEFSEVTAKHRETTQTKSGTKEEYYTIFRGLFIIADFNKYFKTHTVVVPDTAEKLFGKFGQTLQSLSYDRGKLIRLENPDFEKEFCVYGDDQVEARYILTPSLMERILAFKHKWNTRVWLSFLESKVYIAIDMNKNLFEMRIFRPADDYEYIEQNFRFMVLLTEIVEDLNLNTRIWTKE